MKTSEFELIVAIVNSGFEDNVMETAKNEGASGGTVISASGTAKADAEEFFGLSIHPEKSIMLLLVKKEIEDTVLKAIYNYFSLTSMAQGIAFALPVNAVSDNLKKQLTENIEKDNK